VRGYRLRQPILKVNNHTLLLLLGLVQFKLQERHSIFITFPRTLICLRHRILIVGGVGLVRKVGLLTDSLNVFIDKRVDVLELLPIYFIFELLYCYLVLLIVVLLSLDLFHKEGTFLFERLLHRKYFLSIRLKELFAKEFQ
jgi:hypothetical protein